MARMSKRLTRSQRPTIGRFTLSKADIARFAQLLPVDLSAWQLTIVTAVMRDTRRIRVAGNASEGCFAGLATGYSDDSKMTRRRSTVARSTSANRLGGYSPSLDYLEWHEGSSD